MSLAGLGESPITVSGAQKQKVPTFSFCEIGITLPRVVPLGGGMLKLKVILVCAVFTLMLVVLIIEIAELFPGPPSKCTTATPIRAAGQLAYNSCAILDPSQVVFVKD